MLRYGLRLLLGLASLWSTTALSAPNIEGASASLAIELATDCPPGFALNTGQCELRSLYLLYASLQDGGVGGLKTGLPSYRDGFSPQEIDLGRYLFFDPLLSADNSLSCASCHQPDKGFADGLGRSVGMGGAELPRSAPSLWNVAFQDSFFWDARAKTLEEQMLGPLYDAHEMGSDPVSLLSKLNASEPYRQLFAQTWPQSYGAGEDIQLDHIYRALAAFQASLVSLNSRYDQYAHGYADALNEQEKEGMNIFRSFVARCAECHTPPLFTNRQLAVIGTPEPHGMPFDPGAGPVLGEDSLRGAFKIPSLRNIDQTAPYMHSGRFETLRDAAEFYNLGRGHAVPEGEELKIHWHVWEPNLTDYEIDRLVDFMKTLTDESFKPKTPQRLPSGLPLVHDKTLATARATTTGDN